MLNFMRPAAEFFGKGGMLIYPLALSSWIITAIIIERLLSFRGLEAKRDKLMADVRGCLKRKKIIEAISICDKIPRPLARVVKSGLLRHDRGSLEIKETMRESGQRELLHWERYLPILGTLVYLTPLLGLLGTILGIMKVFMAIQGETGFVAINVAGGFWEALLTSALGLGVAIPALLAHNYFAGRVDKFLIDVEEVSAELASLLSAPGGGYEV